jgi:hypothetical protein
VIDTLDEANGSVLVAQWGEAAKEHGGDVGDGGVGDGGSACVKIFPATIFPILSSKMGSFPSRDRPRSRSDQRADPRCSGQVDTSKIKV